MKVAIIADWLVQKGGAEKVLEELLTLYPEADLYSVINFLPGISAKTSFLQHIPGIRKYYRWFLPLMPYAIEQFDLSSYDLIISSSHAVAKGVLSASHQKHICYCHTPMRYAWDLYSAYTAPMNRLCKFFASYFLHRLRLWDVLSSYRVDAFIANSACVQKRIEKIYRRESKVIYPPIDTTFFAFEELCEDYYVSACRLVGYKRVDLIVEAFNQMSDKKLLIIGEGPEKKRLMKKAHKNIHFLGFVTDKELVSCVQKAKAFIHAGIEDFGIAPLQAQSCGTPVIAYAAGGLMETIQKNTGVFFHENTSNSLREAIVEFEKKPIARQECRNNALQFSLERFRVQFKEFIDESITSSRWERQKIMATIPHNLPKTVFKIR